MSTMKKCPYCAEKIQDEAIVCRYCRRDLVERKIDVRFTIAEFGMAIHCVKSMRWFLEMVDTYERTVLQTTLIDLAERSEEKLLGGVTVSSMQLDSEQVDKQIEEFSKIAIDLREAFTEAFVHVVQSLRRRDRFDDDDEDTNIPF
jgi:cell division FtsZ-interacting protein ZapD